MPDLFIVMNDEEFVEAIEYAKQEGAKKASCIMAMNYDLMIKGKIIDNERELGGWFPKFTEYISLKTNDDEVGVLLSPTVWNTYDERIIYSTMLKNKISLDITYDPLFIQPRKMINYIEEEKKKSQKSPINSPWTARDIDVVWSALTAIKGIKNATILTNVDFTISIYIRDIEEVSDSFVYAEDIAKKKVLEEYRYPSVLHLETESGVFNVYMGDVDVMKVLDRLEKMGIDSIIKEYSEEDQSMLLYECVSDEKKLAKDDM